MLMLDTGCGRHNPGAIGASGRLEKRTWVCAHSSKAALEQGGRYRVMLTHYDDVFIPLDPRRRLLRTTPRAHFAACERFARPGCAGVSMHTLYYALSIRRTFSSNAADERLLQSERHRVPVVADLCAGSEICMGRLILPERAG
ncbi:N-acetylmuramoyl-L-alanine amidase [Bradyrhizobium sp. 157]|nr:N-acetylmuramoyl-L-alanine amidase [Bradyrhizobium sp. 157]